MGGSGRRDGVCRGSSGVGMGGYGPWVAGTVGGVEESGVRLLAFPFLGILSRLVVSLSCSLAPVPGSPRGRVLAAGRASGRCANWYRRTHSAGVRRGELFAAAGPVSERSDLLDIPHLLPNLLHPPIRNLLGIHQSCDILQSNHHRPGGRPRRSRSDFAPSSLCC